MKTTEVKLSRLPSDDEPAFRAEEDRAWRLFIAGLRPMSSWLLRASDQICESQNSIREYVGPVAMILVAQGNDVYLGPAAVLDIEEHFLTRGPAVKISNDDYVSVGLWIPRQDTGLYGIHKAEHKERPESSLLASLVGDPDWPAIELR